MKKSQPSVLVIDNYDSFTYNLIQILEECGGCTLDIVRNDQLHFQSVREYQKVLISPGPGLPSEAGMMCEFIKKHAPSTSILGICLGFQAIAEVFGGMLINLPIVTHGLSKRVHIVEPVDYLFTGLPMSFNAGLYHSWIVAEDTLPNCLRVTAMSDDGLVMAISHTQFDVRGIQFHPESIMTEVGKKIIHNWLDHE
jgi:anthranilate synthase component 2